MRAEDQHGPNRHVLDRFNKDGPSAPQLLDHIAVVHDFVVYINRGTIGFQCQLNDIHGPNHASAKSTWANSQQLLSALSVRQDTVRQRHTSSEPLKTQIIHYYALALLRDFLVAVLTTTIREKPSSRAGGSSRRARRRKTSSGTTLASRAESASALPRLRFRSRQTSRGTSK